MKKLCLVVVSTLALTVTAAPAPAAAAAQHAPAVPSGVFCKLFPLLCR